MLNHASVAIIVCGVINQAHDQKLSFLFQDLSAAVENFLLAANILDLGACERGAKEVLGIDLD